MIVNNKRDREKVIRIILGWTLEKTMEVIGREYKPKRSACQNRLLYLWYKEIAHQSGNGVCYERRFAKFTYGAPILVRDDSEFAEFYSLFTDELDYEGCLKGIQFVSVSSIMNVKQFTEYLQCIEQNSVERGHHLTKPDDIYLQAMGIK